MELTLNIYNQDGSIDKTYAVSDFMLTTGVCEDILGIINPEKIMGFDANDDKAVNEIARTVIRLFGEFNPIMKRVFTGLTDEEYRRTSVREVSATVWKIVQYTFSELFTVTEKNRNRVVSRLRPYTKPFSTSKWRYAVDSSHWIRL